MKKILVINGSPRDKNISTTYKMFLHLQKIKGWKEEQLHILDLSDLELPFLTAEMLSKNNNKLSDIQFKLISEFKKYNYYIFIYPTWNYGVPALLKAYLDLIIVNDFTFAVVGGRLQGLLENKHALLINSTGSNLNEYTTPFPMMKDALTLMGITNVVNLALGGVSNFSECELNNEIVSLVKEKSEEIFLW